MTAHRMTALVGLVALVKRIVYALGYRPRPGSLLYSPSRDILENYGQFAQGLKDGLEKGRHR